MSDADETHVINMTDVNQATDEDLEETVEPRKSLTIKRSNSITYMKKNDKKEHEWNWGLNI